MDANTATVIVAAITAVGTAINIVLNRHAIRQNNGLQSDASEIKKQVNGNTQQLQGQLDAAHQEINRLNRMLNPRGEPDRRQKREPFPKRSDR